MDNIFGLDLGVSRNLTVGNRSEFRGDVHVEHGLVVDGWAEFRNVRGVMKGLFYSFDDLEAAHPQPEAGWYALVGSTLPARLYVATEGEWRYSGSQSGETNLYLDKLEKDCAEYREEIINLKLQLTELGATVSNLDEKLRQEMASMLSARFPVIEFDSLDLMDLSGSVTEIRDDLRKIGKEGPVRWTVTLGGQNVGYMDVITAGDCVLTQVLTTHLSIDSQGNLGPGHSDTDINTYYRSTPLNSNGKTHLGKEYFEWTPWRRFIPAELTEDVEGLKSQLATLTDKVEELKTLLETSDANYAAMSVEWLEDEEAGLWSDTLPAQIDKQIKVRVGIDVNTEHVSEGVSDWKVRRHAGDTTADSAWDSRHPLTAGKDGYVTINLGPDDILESRGTYFVFSALYSRVRNGVTYTQIVERRLMLEMGGLEFFIDHGPWKVGERYLHRQFNDEGRLETADSWRYGQKWRNQQTHVSTADNGPGFGNPLWAFLEGDDTFHVGFSNGQESVDPANIYLPLPVTALYHGQDVLPFISDDDIVWSRYSENASGEPRVTLDAKWNAENAKRGKSPVFTEADFQTLASGYSEGLGRITFTAYVTLRDPVSAQRVTALGTFSL